MSFFPAVSLMPSKMASRMPSAIFRHCLLEVDRSKIYIPNKRAHAVREAIPVRCMA